MALFFNSTTDARSSIPHAVSVNPHSCVGHTKEPAYMKRFNANSVLQSRNMPGQDQDSKSLLNSVAASVAVRRNAMELKFLESALTALRLKEKKALRNLENEMRKYRMDLDRIPVRSVTSKIAQNVDRLAPPVVSDEVLLRRVGKNRKLRVSIQQPGDDLKDSALRGPKFSLKPTGVTDKTANEQPLKRNDLKNEEKTGKEPLSAREPENVETADKDKDNNETGKDDDIIIKNHEPESKVIPTDAMVAASKPTSRLASSQQRPMQSPGDLTLTDSIARTCGEYFSLIKIINDRHQSVTASAAPLPPVGVVEPERSLALIEPSRFQSPHTVRLREAGTQIEKRYVTARDDVTVEREMWPSWWTPNSKPVQTESVERARPIAQSYPPVRHRTTYVDEDEALSDRQEGRDKQRHRNPTRKAERKTSRGQKKQKEVLGKPNRCPCAKPRPKTKLRLVRHPTTSESETSDSSSSSQSPAPVHHLARHGVFLTQSSDESSSTSALARELARSKRRERRADMRSVSRKIETRRVKPRRSNEPTSLPVHRTQGQVYPQCSHQMAVHDCSTHQGNYAVRPQSSFHNVNIKAQFQCTGTPCRGMAQPCSLTPSVTDRTKERRHQNAFRQATPLATPVESQKTRTQNSTSGFSSCEMDELQRSTNLPSPVDDSPVVGGLPEKLKLQHDNSLRSKSRSTVIHKDPSVVDSFVEESASRNIALNEVTAPGQGSFEDKANIHTHAPQTIHTPDKIEENEEDIRKKNETPLNRTSNIETRDSRTQTSQRNSPVHEENVSRVVGRTESHSSLTSAFTKPKAARVVPTLESDHNNPVFRIELCAISEDQELVAEAAQVGANAKGQAGVFKLSNPTRNGKAPKKYQLVLNDSSEDRAQQQMPQSRSPIPPPPIPKQNVQRWQSDIVADNVFSREPLPSSAWCRSSQQRKFIPAQCIEPATALEPTPNVQYFEAPGTGKSTVPPSTALVRGEECSDFLQSNSCLSGDFATRWRHGAKSRARSGFTSAGRRSILKPVFEKTYMGCGSGDDHGQFYNDGDENAYDDRGFDYSAKDARPMTTAHLQRRRPAYMTPESRYEEPLYDFTHGSPPEYQHREEITPKHTFLFEATRLPELRSQQGCTLDRDPTFARSNYQISRASKPEYQTPAEPPVKPEIPQPEALPEKKKSNEDLTEKTTTSLKEKVWQIKSPRREPVWKRKRVDSSSSFRQLYDMQEYSLTADQRDPGLGLTSSSSGVIPRFRRASVTSSGELRLQQALALERTNQRELQAKIENFRDRLTSSKSSKPAAHDNGMREIVTRGNSVGRKRRKK